VGSQRKEIIISPNLSNSTSSSCPSSIKTIHSGEMGDISSSSSAKSANSCGIQFDSTAPFSQFLSSQETGQEVYPKTSTQNSVKPSDSVTGLSAVASIKSDEKVSGAPKSDSEFQTFKSNLSPITSDAKAVAESEEKSVPKRKRNQRSAKAKTSVSAAKRKRSKAEETISSSSDAKSTAKRKDSEPKKPTRKRKKAVSSEVTSEISPKW